MDELSMTEPTQDVQPAPPTLHVAPSPHLAGPATTRGMMIDVLIGLAPLLAAAVYFFGRFAVFQVVLCVASCLVFESIFTMMRHRRCSIFDGSAAVTGAILGLSLPWSAPWYVGVIGSLVAIGAAKMLFGGLGQNIFNPAMVGRAFVMISFGVAVAAPAYVFTGQGTAPLEIVTQATPLTAGVGHMPDWLALFLGNVNGSLGETSALACLVGGLYLIVRRSASWRIPAGAILGLAAVAGLGQLANPAGLTVVQHLLGGAFLFGAFFIATDPVTCPVTPRGQWVFGVGFALFVYLIRTFAGYPEGVLFAILLMNMVTPLINRWTIPRPVGGPVPVKKPA